MKKLLLVFMLLIALTGCASAYDLTLDNDRGITLELVEDSLSNNSVLLTLTNNADKTLHFGPQFSIQKFENDKWYTLKPLSDVWTAILYGVDPGNTTELGARNIESMYGKKLSKGKYRYVKDVYFEENDKFTISYEFEIE